MNKITLLGTGTSTGVPILGCNCQVCQSNDVRNKRLRSSALIQTNQSKTLLIDASPDLRSQLLAKSVQEIHAVIITHDHADHTHGIDDLRPYSFKSRQDIPVFTSSYTKKSLELKFPYIFQKDTYFKDKEILGGGIPLLKLQEVSNHINFENEVIALVELPHGHGKTLGVIHQKMAYLVDCHEIPAETLELLKMKNLELLIIDCLRWEKHQTHLHLDLTLKYIQEISPKKAVLTHLGHEFDYLELQRELLKRQTEQVIIGLDGMSFLYP